MKNLSVLFVFILFAISSSFAQETEIVLDKKAANSFPLTFENYNKKNLEVELKRYVKTFGGKVKKNKETKEFFANDVLINGFVAFDFANVAVVNCFVYIDFANVAVAIVFVIIDLHMLLWLMVSLT